MWQLLVQWVSKILQGAYFLEQDEAVYSRGTSYRAEDSVPAAHIPFDVSRRH